MERRTFIKTGALAGAGLMTSGIVFGKTHEPAKRPASDMQPEESLNDSIYCQHDRLLDDAWNAKSAGDKVLEKMVQVTAPPIKGTHDARLLIVGGKAYIVYYANDYKPGENHAWGNILYLEMSVLDLLTMKVERRIPIVKGEQSFDNYTLESGAIYTAPVLQKDEHTIRVFFSNEDPGKRQSQVWYLDFDLQSQMFSKRIYKAKIKTREGIFDMQPQYMYQDLLLGGFQPMEFVPDHAINAFDPRYHEGRIYVPLMIWPHVSGFSVLNDTMDTFELLGFINERGLTEMGASFMPDRKWLAIVRADKEPRKYSFWESPDGREWTKRQGGYFEPKGQASKPTLDCFNGIYYLGWQAEEKIDNAFRSVFNIDISKDGVNWERKYRFETKDSFQYPFFYPYDGRIWFVVTQGQQERKQERIMFGCLE